MQKKMIVSYILIMLAGALLTGLIFFLHYQNQSDNNMEMQMRLTAYNIEANVEGYGKENLQIMINKQSKISQMRVSVISIDGSVLADSESSFENHADRPEILDALKNGEAVETRHSITTNLYYKYFAYKSSINGETIIIRIAKELHPINQVRMRAMLIILIITVAICLIFAWFLIIRNITNIRKLEKIRSVFVSNVTHELKTPLTSIKGFVDTLKHGAINDETVAEKFLDIIEIEADRLSALITDVMELSEMETISSDTGISDYILDDIIDDVISIITPNAQKNNIKLSVNKNPAVSIVRANFDRLKQLLINLLDNAIKYSNSGGSVSLNCELSGINVIFIVTDNGIGIGEEHLPRIFERFYRVDKGRSRTRGGTGLGLSIVKHIVQLYNGELNVKSVEGQGSTFVISLPIAIAT